MASTENARGERRRGFTLVELMVVVVIIGIILSLVLGAAMDAQRRSDERATQALISKLEGGLNERLDSLMQSRPDPNMAHGFMAAVWANGFCIPPLLVPNSTDLNTQLKSTDRAQVFAWYDYLKRELPDVFFIQSDANYPINFAGVPFPGASTLAAAQSSALGTYAPVFLPLGNTIDIPLATAGSYGDLATGKLPSGTFVTAPFSNPNLGLAGAGIFGASYGSAAGLFKNLPGVQPIGYDGVDSNGDGLIDDFNEGGWNLPTFKSNHTHKTARSETLYAVLVEGIGPWGSVFSRDEFTDREVQDTDGDGLPEFVDAWGQPLQFFRWPVLYHSDLQRGQDIESDAVNSNRWDVLPPYAAGGVFAERERDPLDPNQQLTAPQWWSLTGMGGQLAANNTSPFASLPGKAVTQANASGGVEAFEFFFHRLTEPVSPGSGATFWDRGGGFARRAYYSKFLILSGGPDKQLGVFLYSDADMTALGNTAAEFLIANENNALPFALDLLGGGTTGFTGTVAFPSASASFGNVSSGDPTRPSSYDLRQSAQDDISNHNLQSVSGIGGSG
jgi:prepilin-type N-terminal cleavage/methylation domain-containing protein